jgi:hypothetical protein
MKRFALATLAVACVLSAAPTLNAEKTPLMLSPTPSIVWEDILPFMDWCNSYCIGGLTISENYDFWVSQGKPTP